MTFRWGDPDYVRSYIMNIPPESQTAGYHMGSDKFVWGRETMLRDHETPRQLQTKYNWYNFMLWGRMGYNPSLSNEHLVKLIAARFPDIDAAAFFNAWQAASKTYPMATKFHWHSWAYMWHVETCSGYSKETGLNHTQAFYDVLTFIDNPTMPGSGLMKISDYAKAYITGNVPTTGTPLMHAGLMQQNSEQALLELEKIGESNIKEAELIKEDIRAMAHAGLYYSNKIKAATHYAIFQETNDKAHQKEAIQYMLQAYKAWEVYIDIFRTYYDHQKLSILNRVVDYDQLLKDVQEDVKLLGGH